jgi:AP-1-like factor
MDSTQLTKSNTINPQFTLSARQEQLLFAALNSNSKSSSTIDTSNLHSTDPFTMAPGSLTESPSQAPGSGTLNGFDESPFIDYDYEFDADGSFDYDFSNDSQGQMIGKLPGSSSDGDNDTHDKRSHPEDDDDEEDGGGKRREGDEKASKKPGRKPLTSEPTSVSSLVAFIVIAILMLFPEAQGPKPCCTTGVSGAQRKAPEGS